MYWEPTDEQWERLKEVAREHGRKFAEDYGHFDLSGEWVDRMTCQEHLHLILHQADLLTFAEIEPVEGEILLDIAEEAADEVLYENDPEPCCPSCGRAS